MIDSLEEGDVFVVIADEDNEEKVDYYLLQCSRPKRKLLVDTIDDHSQSYDRHSVVVYGRYYAQVPNRGEKLDFCAIQMEQRGNNVFSSCHCYQTQTTMS